MGDLTKSVEFVPLRRISGSSGDVLHALKASAPGFAGFGEAYFSEIHAGAIKSWRLHRRVTTNLVVVKGAVTFVVHDDAHLDVFTEHRLSALENYGRLVIPPGYWFAFRGEGAETSLILSVINYEHDPAESDTRPLDAFPYHW